MSLWDMHHSTVDTPRQALDEARRAAATGAQSDVFVIDHALERNGASDLIEALRAEVAPVEPRIITLTPIAQHEEVRKAREAGVRACVSKPVRQSALYNAFVTAMDRPCCSSPDVNVNGRMRAILGPDCYTRPVAAEDNRVNSRWRWEC